ncbi:hypothetical protein EDE15_3561 [Edaphobacter aggregans]|uniref:Uncharacterized protein n=1 Tax=Edaphobacter aggregans TaxID=570835 RepID=A0A3R9QBW2_9BACT|nr:hypothetical protein EDE15_3561 [Edaphobacter aggregans]
MASRVLRESAETWTPPFRDTSSLKGWVQWIERMLLRFMTEIMEDRFLNLRTTAVFLTSS